MRCPYSSFPRITSMGTGRVPIRAGIQRTAGRPYGVWFHSSQYHPRVRIASEKLSKSDGFMT